MRFEERLQASRVLPVITAYDVESTLRLVDALDKGGMRTAEITLRTEAALESIRAVKSEFPHILVAAGTVTGADNLAQAAQAGADFCVSPGLSETLLQAAVDQDLRILPGVATASEVIMGMDYGLSHFKLFPAVPVGGLSLLKAFAGPFPDIQFCPTGGLTPENFRDFLSLPNVICCGGSWMVSEHLIKGKQWEQIETLAREAMQPIEGEQ